MAARATPPSDPTVCLARLSTHLGRLKRGSSLALRRGLTGRVKVRLRVDASGTPRDLAIAASSGHPLVDEEALELVRRAAPLPRCPGTITVPIDLKLE